MNKSPKLQMKKIKKTKFLSL